MVQSHSQNGFVFTISDVYGTQPKSPIPWLFVVGRYRAWEHLEKAAVEMMSEGVVQQQEYLQYRQNRVNTCAKINLTFDTPGCVDYQSANIRSSSISNRYNTRVPK